jgi:AraC family transcriptional regulator
VRAHDELAGFTLTRLRHDRGRRLPMHSHERAYFYFVARGGYAERFGRTEIAYRPGAAAFHPRGITHRDEIAPGGASLLVVEIGAELDRRAAHLAALGASVQDVRGGELAQAARRLERECRDPARRSPLVIEGLVLEMIGVVSRPRPRRGRDEPAWLASVIDRLHAEFDRRHTLGELARDAGVHPIRLARVFRRSLGVGIGDYVQELRVRWIERRLGEPDIGLAELAVAAGFADQSHMTRVFRNVTGRTPGSLREGMGLARLSGRPSRIERRGGGTGRR